MSSLVRHTREKLRWLLPVLAIGVIGSACELDVADPSVVEDDEVTAAPPAAEVSTKISGLIGDLTRSTEGFALYSGMFTDEMILSGTFPTRLQVDQRDVNFSNATITAEVEEPLQQARVAGEELVADFEGKLGNEDFPQADLRDGIAFGHFVDAFSRMRLGLLWCNVALDGNAPIPSAEVIESALARFESAEAAADEADLPQWRAASVLGQARVNLILGSLTGDASHFADAADLASQVDRSHQLVQEFSFNTPDQFNKYHELTFGSQNEVIRWTIGGADPGDRGGEVFADYSDFVELGIIDPSPGLTAFSSSINVSTPLIYDEANDFILLSSGDYARLIEAEVMLRNGQIQAAEDLVNELRSDWDERWTVEQFAVDAQPESVEFGADLEENLEKLASDYVREMWLSGVRLETLRRYAEEFDDPSAFGLWPVREAGQTCWPVSEQEETGGSP